MSEVDANIEDAAIVSMPASSEDGASSADAKRHNPRFLVSAFNTHIQPFSPGLLQSREAQDSLGDEVAVAFLLKASVGEELVQEMSNLFHTRFPGLVCTVTLGALLEPGNFGPPLRLAAEEVTVTIRLFGGDRVGQLARIAEVLNNCRVTILNLLVTTGVIDKETSEFVEQVGGPLSENVITVAAIDRTTFDEATLRTEVAKSAREVGYEVTSIILERDRLRAQKLARYYLRRKAFIHEISALEVGSTSSCDKAVWSA